MQRQLPAAAAFEIDLDAMVAFQAMDGSGEVA